MQEVATGSVDVLEPSKVERSLAAAGALGMIGGSAAVWYFDPTKVGFLPGCPLYSLTGFACPGCGMTRGFHALFHGDIVTALDYNALFPLFALLIGFAFVSLVFFAVSGRKIPINLLHPNALWVFFVLLLVFGVTRNLPWYPFSVLFP